MPSARFCNPKDDLSRPAPIPSLQLLFVVARRHTASQLSIAGGLQARAAGQRLQFRGISLFLTGFFPRTPLKIAHRF